MIYTHPYIHHTQYILRYVLHLTYMYTYPSMYTTLYTYIRIQVVIFVSKVARARELNKLLEDCNFPSCCIHAGLKQEERIERFKQFKVSKWRICVEYLKLYCLYN